MAEPEPMSGIVIPVEGALHFCLQPDFRKNFHLGKTFNHVWTSVKTLRKMCTSG